MMHRSLVPALLALVLAACDSTGERHVPDPHLVVPGVRVGPYVIGISTPEDTLGRDTAEARARLAAKGVHLEFERGGLLTGVTVESDLYATREGVAVGATRNEVRRALGSPLQAEIGHGSDSLRADAMLYDGITLLLDGEVVRAIRVP